MNADTRVLHPGAIVAGDYRVVRLLAEGGMGAVYIVEQLSTGNQRALKVIREEYLKDAKTRERFQQEARVSARIPSDHVVQVLASGVDPASQMPFMVMELLQGETLLSRVQQNGAVDLPTAMELFEQLCHALSAAHSLGVIHRDLKPENVFLQKSRRARAGTNVKVLDFGVAKVLAEARTTATSAIGTPSWMAPEQTELRTTVSPATDIWALGLLAFYVVTGKYYWRACNDDHAGVSALMRELLFEPLPPASVRARELGVLHLVPQGFDDFFARCLARNPAERFQSVGAAESVLMHALENKPLSKGSTVSDPLLHDARPGGTQLAPLAGAPVASAHNGYPQKGATVLADMSAPAYPQQQAYGQPDPQRISAGYPAAPQGQRPSGGHTAISEPVQRVSLPAVQASTAGTLRGSVAAVPPPPPRSAPRKKSSSTIYVVMAIGALIVGIIVFAVTRGSKSDAGEEKKPPKDEQPIKLPTAKQSTSAVTPKGTTGTEPVIDKPKPEEPRVKCSQAPAKIYFADDFRDATLSWKIDDPWTIGAAAASKPGGAGVGLPDPGVDRAGVAGGSIAGVTLGGNYKVAAGIKALTTPLVNTSGASRVVLQYYRWLNCDAPAFAPHGIEASSDGGATWKSVWKNPGPVTDKAWALQSHDLTSFASPTMKVRFTYQTINQDVYTASGWNIDDVVIGTSECF